MVGSGYVRCKHIPSLRSLLPLAPSPFSSVVVVACRKVLRRRCKTLTEKALVCSRSTRHIK
eukprot:4662629-Pyramimonas_sp.AAC.1